MIIQSNNFSLKLEEILKEEIHTFHFNETERKVIELTKDWITGNNYFEFKTSGSTSNPKIIRVLREQIKYSSQATFEFIDKTKSIETSLLCLNPAFIGGAMVVFRALINQQNLYIIEPTNAVIDELPSQATFDLVSMVPSQFNAIDNEGLGRFKNILIGGAPMNITDKHYSSNVYSTYGMTETISHVAIRRIDAKEFQMTGDAIVRLSNENTLEFNGTITNHKWLSTNDLGNITSETTFEWIGRKDFIINSGGIKINPELIEQKLTGIVGDFMITSVPDSTFGEKLVLIIENEPNGPIDTSMLDKYEVPKKIITGLPIAKTASGKPDRIETRKMLIDKQ